METMGERIAKARMYMNLNQRELAKKANIAEPTLSRYENGYREPKAGTISQIAEALGKESYKINQKINKRGLLCHVQHLA